ncbi:37539_t:CDS:2, partial [Gigaspora margarita]
NAKQIEGYESDSEESDESPSTITEELWSNASAQKLSFEKQKVAKGKFAELNDLYHVIQDSKLYHDFLDMTGTSSSTQMANILSLLENPDLDQTLKIENEFKPILVLLVDGQSAYNPVERSMSTLSEKLGRIILPVDHFGSHLNTMGIDNIHEHKVAVNYIEYKINPFDETFNIS